jgi:hypothetical protein
VALVGEHDGVIGQVLEQGRRWLARLAAGQPARIILDAGAGTGCLHHLEVEHGALLDALGFEQLSLGREFIEALAQLGGILVQTRPGEAPLKNLRLTAVRQIKILGSITPGQSLHLSGSLQGMLDTLGQVIGEIRDDAGHIIITGAVTLAGEK